jgi:23S rRNA (pseudouridine1915-N3)-methyltransferase
LVKIKVLVVGKTKEDWIKQGLHHYSKFLGKYAHLEMVEVREERITKSRNGDAVLETEADRILSYLKKEESGGSSHLHVVLDKGGKQLSSEGLARLLREKLNRGYSQFTFILGGALGLSPKVVKACQLKLSLSTMTFTHEMTRIILLEQIFRAFSILEGTDYHK